MGGVQWNIRSAGFENGEQADDKSLRSSHGNADQRVRFHAEALQMAGKAIGTFVELAITQLAVFCDNCNSIRSLGNLLFELISDGAVARVIDLGSIPLKQLNG